MDNICLCETESFETASFNVAIASLSTSPSSDLKSLLCRLSETT